MKTTTSIYFEHQISEAQKDQLKQILHISFPGYFKNRLFHKQLPTFRFLLEVDERVIGHVGVIHRVVYVDGPMGPKIFYGDYLKMKKKKIEKKFGGASIFADHHYSVGRNLFDNVEFHVGLAKNEKKFPTKINSLLRKHSITGKKYSSIVKTARSCVEGPFGWMKTKFKILDVKFREGETQHKYIVIYSLAFYNLLRK